MTEQQVAAMEADLFSNLETMSTSDDAKFAKELENLSGNDGAAKCWFWCWRRAYWSYYPSYYYYSWYCPVYYVPLRIVTYSIPVVQVTTTPVQPQVVTAQSAPTAATASATAVAGDTSATATASVVTKFLPSSGAVAKGAIVDGKVPENSPLAKLGLRSGDIITKVDGNPVTSLVDARRIKENSNVTYVRGDKIKVAGKPILQKASNEVATSNNGSKSADFDANNIKNFQKTEMSLYEYYDSLEKASAEPAAPAPEYGEKEY